MNPWVRLETNSQNFASIPLDTKLIAELEVLEFYKKRAMSLSMQESTCSMLTPDFAIAVDLCAQIRKIND